MLTILLVDDHEVVRLGLTTLISNYPSFKVIGEASNAAEALKRVEKVINQDDDEDAGDLFRNLD